MRAVPPVALLWLAVFVCSSDQNVLAPNLSDRQCAQKLGIQKLKEAMLHE